MPTAFINTDALKHNLKQVRARAPASKIMSVIKADAYGHGALTVAKALDETDAFAVARLEEGIKLRQQGIKTPIVVLGGCVDAAALQQAIAHQLQIVIHQQKQLTELLAAEQDIAGYWLKFDTGMGRLGFEPEQYGYIVESLKQAGKMAQLSGIMSHLANADVTTDSYTETQLVRFNMFSEADDYPRSLANSAGILAWPKTHLDWVRPGIMLYGVSPFADKTGAQLDLQPVLEFRAELVAIKERKAGDPIGYGCRWHCPQDMVIGVVSVGYGDGYPREMPDGCPVLIKGQKVPMVGQVSMDMITVDLQGLPDAQLGDAVTLWGEGLPVEDIAKCAGTIPYTLLCGITERVAMTPVGAQDL